MNGSKPENRIPNPLDDLETEMHPIDTQHRDACGLICAVRKSGEPTHGNVKRTIEALARMGHRTGSVNGEGDGVGILTDIPRELWSKWLAEAGLRSSLATDSNFWVAHLMIPAKDRTRADHIVEQIAREISEAGLHFLFDRSGKVNKQVLGPNAEQNEPAFYQLVGINGQVSPQRLNKTLFDLQSKLENDFGVHFPSFSAQSVVYKVQGTIEILRRYYPELRDPDYASVVTMGHARYSTNTNPIFERAQPFAILGHNGEFNTISRFRLEAAMLGIQLDPHNSDSQDVDRVLHALCTEFGLDLIEAMEMIFPPYEHDLMRSSIEMKRMYGEIRQTFGRLAQGPAAVATRFGNLAVFSVDALGLRPLWFGETEKEIFASSERGVYPLDNMAISPKPMAPGEKIAIRINPGRNIDILDYSAIQRYVYSRYIERKPESKALNPLTSDGDWGGSNSKALPNLPLSPRPSHTEDGSAEKKYAAQLALAEKPAPYLPSLTVAEIAYPWQGIKKLTAASLSALGWERYHTEVISAIAENGKELIGSLGWDGPLAALNQQRNNIADYFKETVAVVTNPAIDREREQSQFSTQMIIGVRPGINDVRRKGELLVEIETPLVLGGFDALGSPEVMQTIANENGTVTLEQLMQIFGESASILSITAQADESIENAIERLQQEAVQQVLNGTQCLVLDDEACHTGENLWIDPLLATSAIDRALRNYEQLPNLRRRTGIVLRSGSLRDLHDLALSISLGANAVVPYGLYAVALGIAPKSPKETLSDETTIALLSKTISILTKGLQKVTSTIGCHDLRSYGHSFSSIGLSTPVAKIFGTPNYFGSKAIGLTWSNILADAEERALEFSGEKVARLHNPDRFFPKMWKKVEAVATGEIEGQEYTEELRALEKRLPIEIRHILDFKTTASTVQAADVDLSIGIHDLPIIISAMSFGSQGELSYRSYAEAAYKLNTLCINGEGGELSDLMGKYPNNRGQQVASARFGVNIELLNSCNVIEIKIGQGAKPGEGGHLPGFKVTEQVADARHTTPGVALISPSNNHDLYSIEDLAQLIDELHTANPNARVSVKIPVVPGVGIIAVGVAKAGADIITLTGYTGGTGAARAHALRHVGLPAEIGLWLAHRTLLESGLRDDVEIWVDGGMKSGRDAVKMLCLGANRIGFGTMAMVAVGCTICRGCHDGTCHVGITTHVKSREEATAKGFKSFRPFQERGSSDAIVKVFNMLAEDMKDCIAQLGYKNAQDLVGHAELLTQIEAHDSIDLRTLLQASPKLSKPLAQPGGRRLTRPRNTVSRQITNVIADYVMRGEYELTYDDEQVMAMDRALGTHLAGALQRNEIPEGESIQALNLSFSNSAVPGNGLAAFLCDRINVFVEGGAQDGVGKGATGGTITILKGLNHNGVRLDGSVGKSFAYGAQGGRFIVQGDADTRACIRLSGADIIFGGEIKEPLRDELGNIGTRANLKGYAFEYMTSGRALVLGDPGPWICAGMTGGVIYQRVQPEMNLTLEALKQRIAPGAEVNLQALDEDDIEAVRELLNYYIHTLETNHQPEAVSYLYGLLHYPQNFFIKIAPQIKTN